MSLTNKQKAVIHVAKSKTGMSEEDYRALLARYGVSSSSELTHGQFEDLMEHFDVLGFKSNGKTYKKPAESKKQIMAKIEAIRSELGVPSAYLDGMTRKMFKNDNDHPIQSYLWLNANQLHKLMVALTYHQRRKAAR